MKKKDFTLELINILRRLNAGKQNITPQTLILTELDFDSLQMMELLETLKKKYGVDFLAHPHTLRDLRTPESLAAALQRA